MRANIVRHGGGLGMLVSWAAVDVLLLLKVEERGEDSGNALCELY